MNTISRRASSWLYGFFLVSMWITSATAATITFRVTTSVVPEGEKVFVAGNHPALGAWLNRGLELSPRGEGVWVGTLEVNPGERLDFKITRGSWASEALDENRSVPGNHVHEVSGDAVIEIAVGYWKDDFFDQAGQVTGSLEYHRNFEVPGLDSRDVLVWLPPNYLVNTNARYPVLYMHDGQQVFDPATSTHGIDWGVDEKVTELVESGLIKEIIVVGIASGANRTEEYGQGHEYGKLYRAFLAGPLKQFIDTHYRTLSGREDTAVMGSSMGGIASFLMVQEYPETFSMAGCLSSAFWLDFQALEKSSWPGTMPIKIYMDNGGVGLEKKLQPGNDWMYEVLLRKQFKPGRDLLWYCDPDAEHNEAAWSARVEFPLRFFFGIGDPAWVAMLPPFGEAMYAQRDLNPPVEEEIPSVTALGRKIGLDSGDGQATAIQDLWTSVVRQMNENQLLKFLRERPVRIGVGDWKTWDAGEYFAGFVIESEPLVLPEGWEMRRLGGGVHLVFKHPGGNADIPDTYRYIIEWYLPRHGLQASGPMLDRHGEEYGEIEVMVPVHKKP